MTPFFLIYSTILSTNVPLLSELHVYACVYIHTNMFVHICVHVCGNLQYISQYPTHSMYVVFYTVIYIHFHTLSMYCCMSYDVTKTIIIPT